MHTYRSRLLFLPLLALLLSPAVHAAPVTWYLNGVTFADGSRAVGSFVYDTVTGLYTSIDITTTPGTGSSAATAKVTDNHYTVQSPIARPAVVVFWTTPSPVTGISAMLQWGFLGTLSTGGGTIPFDLGSYEGVCLNPTCQFATADSIIGMTAGSVTSAPVFGPRTWYLDNVIFDDGGQATGSFVYDSVTNTYSNVDISVSPGATFTTGYHYGVPGAAPAPTGFANTVRALASLPAHQGDRLFNGNFLSALTNDGGIVGFNSSAQESSCDSADCTVNGANVKRAIILGTVTTVRPAGYTKILSQIVDGGGWQTTLTVTNRSHYAQAYTVTFWQDNGSPWAIPGIGSNTILTVPGNGAKFLVSSGNSSGLSEGWAKVEGYEDYSAMAVYKVAGAQQDQQASVTGDPTYHTSFSMPFDESGGALVGLALTNPSSTQAQTALVVAYDETGKILVNDTSIVLQPLQHTAFVLDRQFPALANQRGKIRVFGLPSGVAQLPFLGLNGMGVRNLADGSFTNLQVTYE
jgi:hypothetical protein